MLGHSYLYTAANLLQAAASVEDAITQLKLHWQYTILPQLIDSVRALGAESLLDPHTRAGWFTEHADLHPQTSTATSALAQLDEFLHQSLELQIVVEGTGLARGARITAQRSTTADSEPATSADPDSDTPAEAG